MADHTLDMSIDPTLEEQELLEETLRRPGFRMSRREHQQRIQRPIHHPRAP